MTEPEPTIRYSTGAPPQAAQQPPAAFPARQGIAPGIVGALAATSLAAGLGIGYVAFHGGSNAANTAAPAAAPAVTTASAATFVLTGEITIAANVAVDTSTNTCSGSDGYNDITAGASVVVSDQSGTVIATGELQDGEPQGVVGAFAGSCRFAFTIAGVPADKPFYGVAVSHRGVVTYDAAKAKGGQVALSLN